jgi:REP-associated tyrosine transposase
MARALRIEFPGAFYHITSRGNEKKDIFRSRKDRERFLYYIESAAERYGAIIHTYCHMTNQWQAVGVEPSQLFNIKGLICINGPFMGLGNALLPSKLSV